MKTKILLFSILIAGLSSCSSSYKTTQTPDDVYYSPVRLHTDDVRRDTQENTQTDNNVYTNSDDHNLRVRVRNRRYRTYDRYDDRYDYPYGYNNPVYTNPKTTTPANTPAPRKYNLGVYKKNNPTPAVDPTTGKQPMNNSGTTNMPVRNFGNSSSTSNTPVPVNNGSAVGNFIRKVFSGGNNNSNNNTRSNDNSNNSSSKNFDTRTTNTNNNSTNTNTSTNNNSSNSSSGSSSSGSSGSAPVRVFK